MQSNDKQAYDRGTSLFSPEGRILQVEYAREAVKRGSSSIGVRTDEGVVLGAFVGGQSDLLVEDSVEKIHKADDHIGVATAGHVADGRQLVDFARRQAQADRLRYNAPITLDALTKNVTDHIQQYTQAGGARPYGASLILAGVDKHGPHVYEVDPSGAMNEWHATAVGERSPDIMDYLEANYDADASLEEAMQLCYDALAESLTVQVSESDIVFATVDAESGVFEFVEQDDVSISTNGE